MVAFKARAVVIATGGYEPYSFKCCHSDMTGDGLAMAFRAGARLADMEFLLTMPGVLLSPIVHRGSILPFVLHVGKMIMPNITDNNGENIRKKIPDELWEMAQGSEWMKLIYSFFWTKEIMAGNGTANGRLFFDFSKISKFKQLPGGIKAFMMLKLMNRKAWRYQGEDMRDLFKEARRGGRWEVGLSNQYTLGGIVVDTEMSCGIPGLFAGGEVASGFFGANRVASALTEAIITGHRSGKSAAEFAKESNDAEIDNDQLSEAAKFMTRYFNNKGGNRATVIRNDMEQAATSGFALFRNATGLNNALSAIVKLRREELPRISFQNRSPVYNLEWIQALHTENLLTCTEVGIRSALERTESRGYHVRTDFPTVDNEHWLQRIACKCYNNEINMTKFKPNFTRIFPEPDHIPDIMAYAIHRKKEMAMYDI